MEAILQEMFDVLSDGPEQLLPSKFWLAHNKIFCDQLEKHGYENFKRTLGLYIGINLFGSFKHEQTKFLMKNLPFSTVIACAIKSLCVGRHDFFETKPYFHFNFLTYLLWEYMLRNDKERISDNLREPEEGNPARVFRNGRIISQEIASSVLEFKTIMDSGIGKESIKSIMELGAGYGRNAFVFLNLLPTAKYLIVDIPPALYIAQTYLCSQFPKKKAFKFRKFSHYSEINEELETSEMAFFLPNQLNKLPDKMADLFVSISTFHEMRRDHVEYYFSEIDRLAKRYFYFKQRHVSANPTEDYKILESDYPVRKHWRKIFWRDWVLEKSVFFEALLAT